MHQIFKNMPDPDKLRSTWVTEALQKIPAGQSLIDCGAGEQRYKKDCAHLIYTSQDFCQFDGKAIAGLDKDYSWDTSKIDIVSDITSIPVADASFDNVLCTEVFEHIPHPENAVKEFARILRAGGKLILTAPFASYTHMAPYHFCTGFSRYWYERVLEDAGFEVEKITSYGNYFDCVALDLRRVPVMTKTYAAHPAGICGKVLLTVCIKYLDHISHKSAGSEELDTFGYMVIATKVNDAEADSLSDMI